MSPRRRFQTDAPKTDDPDGCPRDGGYRRMSRRRRIQTDATDRCPQEQEQDGGKVCVCVCLSVCVSLSVYLSICLPACLLACLPARLAVCLPACMPACLPACLSVCLSVCFLLLGSVYYVFPFDSVYQLPKLLSIYILLILLSFDWYMFC